jgi:hypothetical protein
MGGIQGMVMNNRGSAAVAGPTLVYDLDAATYTGLSASFNGTSQDLSVPANAGFDFGTGDFTIECWINATQLKLADVYVQIPGGSAYIFFGLANVSGAMRFNNNNGASYSPFGTVNTANSLISINTWYHVALMRSGNTLSLFINGVCRGTKSGVSADAMGGSSDPVKIAGENRFPGRISNMHVVKGSTVYTYGTTVGTTYFTPPTTPLTAVAGTQLLLPLTTTPFTDISTNTLTVTNTGTVASIVLSPFTSTDATGTYTITRTNAGSISWSSSSGGIFSKSNNVGTDVIYGGPNWVTGQSYSVFMAYQRTATSSGRLLNTQSEASKDWLMGLYNGNPDTFYPNFSVNLPGSGADLVWHFGWATWNTSTSVGQLYTATSAQPTGTSFTGTNGGGGGFNQLRMFSRSAGSEVQTADIGFVKAYSGVLTLADVQGLYNQYKARFGY